MPPAPDSEENRRLLQLPDAVAFRRTHDIQSFIQPFTVALAFIRVTEGNESLQSHGSGMLLDLFGSPFVLTAGHVLEEGAGLALGLTIKEGLHRYRPEVISRKYVYDPKAGLDWGYARLANLESGRIKAEGAQFLGPAMISLCTADELRRAQDWHVILGYPAALSVDSHATLSSGVYLYLSNLAGTRKSPDSPEQYRWENTQHFDLVLQNDGVVELSGAKGNLPEITSLKGASGCGSWKTGVRPEPSGWEPSLCKLVALHVGTLPVSIEHEGHQFRFARQVCIGHVLRQIADNEPDLARRILEVWPGLSTY